MDQLLRLLGILTLCGCFAVVSSIQPPPPLLIKDKSYTLWTEVEITHGSDSSSTLEVVETYSHWQDRSIIENRIVSKTGGPTEESKTLETALFFADKRQVLVKSEQSCDTIDREVVTRIMNLNFLESVPFEKAILGPSKVLHILSDQLDKFTGTFSRNDINGEKAQGPINRYIYDLAQGVKATLYYYDGYSNLPNGLPFGIMLVKGGQKKLVISYTFKRIDIEPEGPIFGSADSIVRKFQSQQGNEVRYDALAVQPSFKCGSSMLPLFEEGKTNPLLDTKYRFSFHAKASLTTFFKEPLIHHVAYEPSISTLRVDRVQDTKMTQTLVDYNAGELFHSMKRRAQIDDTMDHIVQVNIDPNERMESSCIRAQSSKQLSTLGEMLFGATKVVYLGLAEVRGIEARAYMAMDSSWPQWFQQPSIYYEASRHSDEHSRNTSTRFKGDNEKLTTVFYMSNNAKEKESDEFRGQLLLIEIMREVFVDLKTNSAVRVSKSTQLTHIPIYDFSWELGSDAPNGQSIEDFFSLGDSCVSPTNDDNHYAEVDLLLERNWPLGRGEQLEWLREPARRDFALMRMVEEDGGLPSSMIYDIDSRRVDGPLSSTNSSAQSFHVAATMRAVEHTRALTKLIRIGKGTVVNYMDNTGFTFTVPYFQSCYVLASHMKFDAVMFYSSQWNTCTVYRATDMESEKINLMVDFEDKRAKVEIYKIEHMPAGRIGARGDQLTKLAHSKIKLNKQARLLLVDPKAVDGDSFLQMALKSIEVRELDRKEPVEIGDVEFADLNKFVGVGLAASEESELTRLIQPDPLEASENSNQDSQKFTHLTGQMTAGWCEAECLADFGCQSYSVCLRNSVMQCVLSKVNFRSSNMLAQLAQMRDTKIKNGEQRNLQVDQLENKDAVVPVVKRASCELHNKSYKKFFVEKKKNDIDVLKRRLHPVSGREHCAKLCVDFTIQLLKDEVMMSHKINAQVFTNPESHPDEVKKAWRGLKESNLQLCSGFMYLDASELLRLTDSERLNLERISGTSDDVEHNGYCIVGDTPSKKEIEELTKANLREADDLDVMVERYDFDFSFMFEKHHGVSLGVPRLTSEVKNAFRATRDPKADEEDFGIVRDFMNDGNNLDLVEVVDDPRKCLRACFLQTSRLWPSCKSVDIFETSDTWTKKVQCYYNTRSLEELLLKDRTDLIHATKEDQTRIHPVMVERITHYEPKAGFIGETLGLMSKLQVSEAAAESSIFHAHKLVNIGAFGLMLTILLAAIAGISIGSVLGQRVLELAGGPREDAETLVKPTEVNLAEMATMSDLENGLSNGQRDE